MNQENRLMIQQLILAVKNIHKLDVIHRDLKPENLFVVEVEIESFETDVKMFSGRSLSDAVKDYLSINPVVSEMLKDSPDDLKDQVVNAVIEVFTPYYYESGLIFPSASWIVNANKKV